MLTLWSPWSPTRHSFADWEALYWPLPSVLHVHCRIPQRAQDTLQIVTLEPVSEAPLPARCACNLPWHCHSVKSILHIRCQERPAPVASGSCLASTHTASKHSKPRWSTMHTTQWPVNVQQWVYGLGQVGINVIQTRCHLMSVLGLCLYNLSEK